MGKAYAGREETEPNVTLTVRPRKLIVYDPMPGFRRRR